MTLNNFTLEIFDAFFISKITLEIWNYLQETQ